MRRLSPARRYRPVCDERVCDREAVRAHDPRVAAHRHHAALASRSADRQVQARRQPDGRSGPHAGALDRSWRAARHGRRSARSGEARSAGMATGHAGPRARYSLIRSAALGRDPVPVPGRCKRPDRRQVGAGGDTDAGRPARRAPHPCGLHLREAAERSCVGRTVGSELWRVRRGRGVLPGPEGHGHLPAARRPHGLPDALHALWQGRCR